MLHTKFDHNKIVTRLIEKFIGAARVEHRTWHLIQLI